MPGRSRGVTLLELMTAMAVLAILASLAIPSFASIVRNSQIAGQSANLVQALNLARSEALKRGVRVSVCAAATNDACAATPAWDGGWLVFADDFGAAGVVDVNDQPIQNWPARTSGVQITAAETAVSFTRMGRAEFPRTFSVSKVGCSENQKREIDVAISGRIGLKRVSCT
jgi:type IV fimbrial biogenesis protein FimT